MDFQPIAPFEPVSANSIPEGKQWIAQIKWDGVRILTYYDGKEIRLFNRKKNERTQHYPELLHISSYCTAKSVILDGEIIALGSDGKPSFHEVMRRDALRRIDRIEQIQNIVPITYMIFDVIFYNGSWVDQEPLAKRLQLLSEMIRPSKQIQVVSSYEDSQAVYTAIKEQELEGIIVKDRNSTYFMNGKNDRWQKVKNYKDLFAVVGGVTFRSGLVNSLLLGLYNEKGQLYYIGHAGTGKLTQNDWRNLTEMIQGGMIIAERPFINLPERNKEAIWIVPKLTVKVKFMEWTRSKTLRQPSIQAFMDLIATDCTFDQIE